MKLTKYIIVLLISGLAFTSCKKEEKKETLSLAISGMTCEIGCAKTIESKLSKKEGVIDATVIFKDSIASISYNPNTTNKSDLIAFVDGIAGGELYKATEISQKPSTCSEKDKEACEQKKMSKTCKKECSMDCCTGKKG